MQHAMKNSNNVHTSLVFCKPFSFCKVESEISSLKVVKGEVKIVAILECEVHINNEADNAYTGA